LKKHKTPHKLEGEIANIYKRQLRQLSLSIYVGRAEALETPDHLRPVDWGLRRRC